MKRIIKKIAFLFLVIIPFSCINSYKREVKRKLEHKYGEKFKVTYNGYSYILGFYQYKAHPVRNKEMSFVGQYEKDFAKFTDPYPGLFLSHKYTSQLNRFLKPQNTPVHVKANIGYSNYPFVDGKLTVDSLEVLELNKTSSHVKCDIKVFFFEELTADNKISRLAGLEQLILEYSQHPMAHFKLDVFFFNDSYLETHSIYDFEEIMQNNAFIPPELETFVCQRLHVMLNSQQPLHLPDINELFKLTKTVTPDHFRVYPVSLNEK